MRNPKRIDRILKLIEKIWKAYPDLRLCQLIGNCFVRDNDNYYEEDYKLEKRLHQCYHIGNEMPKKEKKSTENSEKEK